MFPTGSPETQFLAGVGRAHKGTQLSKLCLRPTPLGVKWAEPIKRSQLEVQKLSFWRAWAELTKVPN